MTSDEYPMLHDAIGRDLILAPAVELPGISAQNRHYVQPAPQASPAARDKPDP